MSNLEIKTAQRQGQPHIIRCSGMQSEGKDLKEAAIAICQKLGIEFDSPTDLTDTLKHNFADSPNSNLIISFLKPEKVATK